MQFKVIASNLGLLEEKFAKLNKKAEKYGNEPLSLQVLNTFEERDIEWATIEVTGCTPLIGKNKLIGVIAKLEDGTNIVKCVPGQELPEEFRESEFTRCDHCHINRFRKEVVIVQDETGKYIQLGKTCLKDYLGISLENLVDRFTWVYSECENAGNEDEEYGPSIESTVNPLYYLQKVATCVRKMGYVSSKAAYDDPDITATKTHAWDIAVKHWNRDVRDFIKYRELYTEQDDINLAENAFNWASSSQENGDFWYNVKAILRQERISYKNIGFIACLITMYQRHIQAINNKVPSNSQYIGDPKVKGRLEREVTCVFSKEIESNFGFKTLYKFLTKDGCALTWFCTGKGDFRVNQEYNIAFSVKGHQEFNGEKQTIITRVKDETEKLNLRNMLSEIS